MSSGGLRGRRGMSAEPTEPVLEQRVRTLEIVAQPARRRRAVLAGQRLQARGAKELAMNADQERGGDPGVARIDPFLLERVGQRLRERPHHLELLRAEGGRVFEGAGESGEPGAREPRALTDLQPAKRVED